MQSSQRSARPGTKVVPRPGPRPPLTSLSSVPRLPRLKERPVEPAPSKWQTPLFALVLLLLIFGLAAGWGYRAFLRVPSFTYDPFAGKQETNSAPAGYSVSSISSSSSDQASVASAAPVFNAQPTQAVPTTPSTVNTISVGALPLHSDTSMRLDIPSIGVSVPLETVGLVANDHLDMPLLHPWDGAGLYKQGAMPGSVGSALVDGYQSHPDGSPAVFSTVSTLNVGDDISVWSSDGTILHFNVLSVRTYTSDQAPLSAMLDDAGGQYLDLIAVAPTGSPRAGQQVVVHAALD